MLGELFIRSYLILDSGGFIVTREYQRNQSRRTASKHSEFRVFIQRHFSVLIILCMLQQAILIRTGITPVHRLYRASGNWSAKIGFLN